jgi:hypothetical protein
MARPVPQDEDRIMETWEIAVPGTVYVWVYDKRDDSYRKQHVGGKSGSARLHITRGDRKYNQEQIPVENRALDPFTNGALRLIESAERDEALDIRYHYTNEQLVEMFEIRDPELFKSEIAEIESELILRRLYAMAEDNGTVTQVEALREVLQDRYPIGGTQKTVREMIEAGERIGAAYV